MKRVVDLALEELKGKHILVRAEFNEPMGGSVVRDDFRLRKATTTISYLRENGARVIVCAHIGHDNPTETLAPISQKLKPVLPHTFVRDIIGPQAQMAVDSMIPGDVLLLENLRQHPGEVANDTTFAKSLARFADIYVNDAFSVSHREHASIVGVPQYLPSYAGILMCDEFDNLSRALTPEHPAVVVVGGAKFETKEPLLKKLLEVYDHVFVGGAIANDLLKARGFPVGRSRISTGVPSSFVMNHPRLMIPSDVTVERIDGQSRVVKVADVRSDDKIVDIGPDSFAELARIIRSAKFVLWNGPTGLYEDGYSEWTEAVAQAIAGSSAHTVVGGGDTIATIAALGIDDKFTFLSTAGGALLEFLMKGTLPGIEALE